jgi:hypothetical protein
MAFDIPDYIDDLPENDAQSITVRQQGDGFVAVIQRDGAGEDIHWVLIPRHKIRKVVDQIEAAAV